MAFEELRQVVKGLRGSSQLAQGVADILLERGIGREKVFRSDQRPPEFLQGFINLRHHLFIQAFRQGIRAPQHPLKRSKGLTEVCDEGIQREFVQLLRKVG